jgi:hypothetical protein
MPAQRTVKVRRRHCLVVSVAATWAGHCKAEGKNMVSTGNSNFLTFVRAVAVWLGVFALTGCNGPGSQGAGAGSQSSSVALSAASYSVAQSAGSVSITVNRSGDAATVASVSYQTSSGTATPGTDYTSTSGTLQWALNDMTPKSITVPVSNATVFSGSRSFNLALTNPGGDTSIGQPGNATVTIMGGAGAGSGMGGLAFSSSTYTVAQTAGSLTVTVSRTGGSSGAVGISYSTANGTAVAGTDYTAANGTLQWADGDTSAKTFAVTVSQTTPFTGNKSFTVTLATPTGGATLSTPNTATVTINGGTSAATGSLQLSAATYAIMQAADPATVTVNRAGGSFGATSVAYATSDGTAVAGTDYTATSGTLSWASGDATSKTFTVAISTATPFVGSKQLNVTLSNPGGGATLGTPSAATVTINGSGVSSGAPTAVGNLQLVNQGGPGNNKDSSANSLSNYQAISWTAASAGANPVAKYNIYRNGALYATQTAATVFSGYIAGNTLTVTSVSSGTVLPGVRYSAPGLLPGTLINAAQSGPTTGKTGTYPVNNAQTLGNSGSPVTFTAWLYIDTNATNSNSPGAWSAPCNIYTYDVTAVDSQGIEGPHAAQFSAWGYQAGFSNWNNLDLSYGGVIENYASTTGSPKNGYDISLSFPSGGFQPTADAMQAPEWDLEIGAFNYFTVDVNPGSNVNFQTSLSIVSRLPPGDVYSWHGISDIWPYGTAPKANTWATYKVPLASILGVGTSTFTGSISGTTLTVTAVLSGAVGVDAGGYVTGPGVPAGTYITAFAQKASVGTFTIAGPGVSASLSVPSGTLSFQRTSLYKLTMQPNANVTFYVDNMGFEKN